MIKKLKSKYWIILVVLALIGSATFLLPHQEPQTKIVTNLSEKAKEQVAGALNKSEFKVPEQQLDASKQRTEQKKQQDIKQEIPKIDLNQVNEKQIKDTKEDTKEIAQQDTKEIAQADTKAKADKHATNQKKDTINTSKKVIIEGIEYSDYKGPVQGEIKYQEGTQADVNSYTRKATGDIGSPYKVSLRVTTDFGHNKVFAKNVGMVKDEVGMEVLFRNLDIQTAYGGGFVNAINGIESHYTFFTGNDRKKLDWFYWVNGILAPIGVGEYRPQPGDVIWWDYHDWGTSMFIPAIIGSYPQPFRDGWMGSNPGTVILYTKDYENQAKQLKASLQGQGVKQIDAALYDATLLENPKKYYMVIGVWDDLVNQSKIITKKGKEINVMEEANNQNVLIGIHNLFKEGKLYTLDYKGNSITSYEEAGAIYAYSAGLGSTKPTWMITGTNDAGIKKALDIILNKPDQIKDTFGIVISTKGIEEVPYSH